LELKKIKYLADMEVDEKYGVGHLEGKPFTNLVTKHYSSLVIRKYTHWGFPIYVGIVTDESLSDLDEAVTSFVETNKKFWRDDLQSLRDFAGALTEDLVCNYKRAEAVGVVIYADKCFISSLHGDFMNHTASRIEFFGLLQMSTGV